MVHFTLLNVIGTKRTKLKHSQQGCRPYLTVRIFTLRKIHCCETVQKEVPS